MTSKKQKLKTLDDITRLLREGFTIDVISKTIGKNVLIIKKILYHRFGTTSEAIVMHIMDAERHVKYRAQKDKRRSRSKL